VSLNSIKKEHGDKVCLVIISKALKEFLKFVPNQLDEHAIVDYAEMIMNNYGYDKVDDILMCLRDALSGKFGKEGQLFGDFNYQKFGQWMKKHLEGKAQHKENIHLDTKAQELHGSAERSHGVFKIQKFIKHRTTPDTVEGTIRRKKK